MTDALDHLARDLDAIAARYDDAGNPVTGIRAVEPEPRLRRYLCVRRDQEVFCVDADGHPVDDPEERRRTAAAVLLVEHVEECIDGEECRLVATLADRLTAAEVDERTATMASGLSRSATALADWRLDPMRAIARIAELDRAASLQSDAHVAHGGYLAATEPLVGIQDTLDGALVELLRDLENACGRAGIAASLSGTLATVMDQIDADAARLLGGDVAPRERPAG